jgi:hypothetical protein
MNGEIGNGFELIINILPQANPKRSMGKPGNQP